MTNKEEVSVFSETIENLVSTKNISYFDAILLHCDQTGMEPEIAAKLISPTIKARIAKEARELHFLQPETTKTLPLKKVES